MNLFSRPTNFATKLGGGITLTAICLNRYHHLTKSINAGITFKTGKAGNLLVVSLRPLCCVTFELHDINIQAALRLLFLATRTVSRQPLCPGTLPFSKIKFFSGRTLTTLRFWQVRRFPPILPGIFLFLKTLPGH